MKYFTTEANEQSKSMASFFPFQKGGKGHFFPLLMYTFKAAHNNCDINVHAFVCEAHGFS